MPIYNQVYNYTITNGGGTITLSTSDSTTTRYIFSGTATLAANWVIQPGVSPLQGMEFDIRWQAAVTQGANTITIFGRVLSDDEALSDLTINCYYNGSVWEVDVVNNDLVIDTDSPVPFRGLWRTDAGDSSIIKTGITYAGGEWKGIISYEDSTGEILHGLNIDNDNATFFYYKDLSDGHLGLAGFHGFLDGMIGVLESSQTSTSKIYGFSTHSDTSRPSADFYEHDPTLDLDTKYIWIDDTNGITSKVLYNIVDANNYDYNSFTFSETEYTFGFGGTVVAGVDTPSTNVVTMKLTNTTFNVIPSIPNYADDTAADADADLDSGALYTTTAGGRIVYRKP